LLGHRIDADPDLHLIVDGAIVLPETIDGLDYRFNLPAGTARARPAVSAVTHLSH
jgi:hypothetical protein